MNTEVVLAGGCRTPIGNFLGGLSTCPAPRLGALVVRTALERAGVPVGEVDEVVLGNVLSAGLGQNVARQASIGSGLSSSVPATTVNKVCGSGLKAVMLAAQAIRCGDASAIVAGGTENMSGAPYLLPRARRGHRLGHAEVIDSLIQDGLWDSFGDVHMGTYGDACAREYSFTREQQDDFAVESYRRAQAAIQTGAFSREIVVVPVEQRTGSVMVETDEEPTRFDEAKLRSLHPAFGTDGTVTAGNASSINDGAAAVVVLAAGTASRLGVSPEARILGAASFSREPEWFTLAPIGAIRELLASLSLKPPEIDLFEINEAFASVPMAAARDLAIPLDRINVHGGAVALGHPIGASGSRILVTLINALRARNASLGVVALCIGGGEAVAMAVERL